jgi:hypothetical protein
MPEDMPEHMPEDMPDRMPDRMPEDMSDRMPEDLPGRKCINVMVGIIRSEIFFFKKKNVLQFYPLKHVIFHNLLREISVTPCLVVSMPAMGGVDGQAYGFNGNARRLGIEDALSCG